MTAEIRAGTVFAGCEVERLLGRGGAGAAYLARRQADGRAVVLKFLAPEVAHDPDVRARFLREGQAQQRTPPHPNVVRVHGVHEERGLPFLVMDHAPGRTLLALAHERGGRVPAREALGLARDVARGLAVVHAQGFVHRDVKPENVMVGPDGVARLLDFGLAKDLFQSGLTAPGQLLGTAYYMAPEQWDDAREAGAESDLFALGATLYHLLAGRPPFVGADVTETFDLVESGDYPPLAEAAPELADQLGPDVAAELERVVAQLLQTEPALRYALAEAVARDLERLLAGQPAQLPCLVVEAAPPPPGQPEVPGLVGLRVPLVPGTRWSLGREGCAVSLAHPTVSRQHAELRRDADGFVLADLKSSHGTFVGDERVARPRTLADGDLVRLGDVRLRFRDPRHDARAGDPRRTQAFALDVERLPLPAAEVEALVRARDPRTLLVALERLAAPTPALFAWLTEVTGQAHQDVASWLAWWARVRHERGPQVVPDGPPGPALVLTGGTPPSFPLAGQGVVFLGRDEKCHVQLSGVARLEATVLRLDRRHVIVGERITAGFLAPGQPLVVGGVRLDVV
jgi:hypothetical protein